MDNYEWQLMPIPSLILPFAIIRKTFFTVLDHNKDEEIVVGNYVIYPDETEYKTKVHAMHEP